VASTNAEWLGPPLSLSGRLSTLQDSLHGTDDRLAPPSRRDTPLQHLQSPGSTGSLLRGSLAITTTGLAPASRQRLSRHTSKRSLRIEYSICSNCVRNSFSGGIEGRPTGANMLEPATTGQALRPPWPGWRAADDPSARASRAKVTEHVILLLIGSSHGFSYHSRLWIRSSFSAAC
jgi:hypothetical protein